MDFYNFLCEFSVSWPVLGIFCPFINKMTTDKFRAGLAGKPRAAECRLRWVDGLGTPWDVCPDARHTSHVYVVSPP